MGEGKNELKNLSVIFNIFVIFYIRIPIIYYA